MTILLPGTQVHARGLQWEIVHVEPAGEQQRFRLRCLDGALRGKEFDFLHPLETIEPVAAEFDPARAGRLRPWLLYHQAFLLEQALGPSALLAVQPGRLDIAPYQLVPVMRALRMSRPRLLLADGVGLGKTVQAGLVMAELIARRRAHRILIVSPAGLLLEQWRGEMRDRFGLRFETISSTGELQELRRQIVLGANPFDHKSLCLVSIDFAKQEKVLQELERASWDLAIIDEAHHCVKMGHAGDWEDSRRRRLAEVVSRQSDGLLLLTATPHDGFDPHFASIMELLDPSLLDGRGSLRGELYRRHVVRRLKQHVKDPATGQPMFRMREVVPRPVEFDSARTPAFAAMQRAVLALIAPSLKRAMRRKRYEEVLAFISLLKRSVSTVTACRNTLAAILDRYDEAVAAATDQQEARKQRLKTLAEYRRRLSRYGALSYEEERDQEKLEAEDMAAEIAEAGATELREKLDVLRKEQRRERERAKESEATRAALAELVELADRALSEDPKLDAVVEQVRAIRSTEPEANVLIYSEYVDSQRAVVTRLREAISCMQLHGDVLSIVGEDSGADRSQATDRFSTEDNLVLVSTDATAEGLNLHERCHHLIHLELPYNPNRLEQRNGRIDRYGQRATPQVKYLYLVGTFEERLLLRLIAKYERQRARLTFMPNTLGGLTSTEAATAKLIAGLADEELSLFKRAPQAVVFTEDEKEDVGSPEYNELLAEIERSMSGYEKAAKTHAWLSEAGLNAEARLVAEATKAHDTGEQLSAVDLLHFVCEALSSESRETDPIQTREDGIIWAALPSEWTFGLEDLPGYEQESRRVRLTTDKNLKRDGEGRTVGYLGRAHPLVRRALDRVRNVRFGDAEAYIDRRVTAISADVEEPTLLWTFLGLVESGRGREFERLAAVRTQRAGSMEVQFDAKAWLPSVEASRLISTKGLWEKHFASWGLGRKADAARAVNDAFAQLAADFVEDHKRGLIAERQELDQWIAVRAEDLCGSSRPSQVDLFAAAEENPRWQGLSRPDERLAAFSSNSKAKAQERREADGVLKLYQLRLADLDARVELRVPEPVPIGLLMLVPSVEGGARHGA